MKVLAAFSIGCVLALAASHYLKVLRVIHETTGGRCRGVVREWRGGEVYDWSRN